MLIEVKIPQLSESVTEATLLSWHKKQGEFVKRDENLIDVETDKVVLELPAPESGVLSKVIKGDGSTVVSNEVIATIDTEGKAVAGAAVTATTAAAAPAAKAPEKPPSAPVASAKAEAPAVMPSARKIAADNNLDTSQISGSGRGGRVTKEDVVVKLQAPQAPRPAAPLPSPVNVDQILGDRPEQRVPMSK